MIHLRQICLVAEQLKPVVDDLTQILGLNVCFIDPGVKTFGLENSLMPIGTDFLEVVAPIQENTAAGRYLKRRHGDGGYMVITQADSRETQQTVRQNALDQGVRIAWETERDDWNLCQLHPRDMVAGFFEVESDAENNFKGNWHPAGGKGWQSKLKQDVSLALTGVELQSHDPEKLAQLWASIAAVEVDLGDVNPKIELDGTEIRFVEAIDDRGPGIAGLDILVADKKRLLDVAKQRGCYINDRQVDIGGVHFYLIETGDT